VLQLTPSRFALPAILISGVTLAVAQTPRTPAAPPDLTGVYQPISPETTLPGGLKNAGSPAGVALVPAALQQMKTIDLKTDPYRACQPIGPFRMMAREQTKIELIPVTGMIVMLFEDLSRGMMRTIYLKRGHPEKLEPTWLGDSVGRWEGDTLIVDTVGFNDRTWLNEEGAQHSDALHLVERIHPILGGRYLEYKMTAEDPKVLVKPHTYTRYYEKLKTEIIEDVCEDDQ
jgi:hypothetical protein